MRQEDYLLREIQRISLLLGGILNKLGGGKNDTSISVSIQFEEMKEKLLNDSGIDIDEFLSLTAVEIEQYIQKFSGLRGANIELLADIFGLIGMEQDLTESAVCNEKALILYELCNSRDRTFSMDRETKIKNITKILHP